MTDHPAADRPVQADRPVLDLLVADGAPVEEARAIAPDTHEAALSALYAHPAPPPGSRTWVRANMVTTLDGAATGADGASGAINDDADHRVFRVLRAAADVVLVGAGTVRTEGYTPLSVPDGLGAGRASAGRSPHLELAIVTRSGELPEQITDLSQHPAGTVPPIVLTTTSGAANLRGYPADRVVVTGETAVDLTVALDALADRGLVRVLAEGGPSLLGDLVDGQHLDELCVTTSPLVVGGPAPRIVRTADYLQRDGVPPARLLHLLYSGGVLLARWLLGRTGLSDRT